MEDLRIPITDVSGPLALFFEHASTLAEEIQNQIDTGYLDMTILNDLQEFGEVYLQLMLGVNASLTARSQMFANMVRFFQEINRDDKTDNSA